MESGVAKSMKLLAKKGNISKSCFDEIRGTEKHETVGEKSKKVVRVALIKYDAPKSMKLVRR